MRVFKYCGPFGANILTEGRIRVSQAHLLNDPFELSPLVDPSKYTMDRAISFLRQDDQVEEWYRKEGPSKGFTNKKRYRRWYLANLRERAAALMPNVPKNVEAARARFAETFSQHWRLFCVSLTPVSILMWSHYAKEHTGIVIEFDFSEQPFRSLGEKWILPVQYSDSRVLFDYKPNNHAGFIRSMVSVVSTKAKAWEYEQEVRAVFPSTACSSDGFIGISPRAVKRVILGCRATSETKSQVRAALQAPHLSHVILEKAVQSKAAFQLDLVTV